MPAAWTISTSAQGVVSIDVSDDHPDRGITWFQARDFCAERGARLPTEAEWEYAARGPDGLLYPWGNEFDGDRVVSSYENPDRLVEEVFAEVGSHRSGMSWVGAFDLSGSVSEWTSTIAMAYPYNAEDGRENSADTTSLRVLRGGSGVEGAVYLTTTSRRRNYPTELAEFFGFRCARPVDSQASP